MTLHRLFTATLAPIALLGLTLPAMAEVVVRQQTVRPLPGELDAVLMVNDNNPAVHLPRRRRRVLTRCAEWPF